MNIHIAHDDKFLDYFIYNAALYTKTKNKYIVLTDNKIIHTKSDNIIKFGCTDNELQKAAKIIKDAKNVYFHSFSPTFAKLILKFKLDEKHQLIWLFFGAEVFNLNKYFTKFLMPQTSNAFKKTSDLHLKLKVNPLQSRRNIINYRFYKKSKNYADKIVLEGIKKIHHFAHFIYEDYSEYIKPINSKINFIDWSYLSISQIEFKNSQTKTKSSEYKILLGNSGSIFNNHIDGLDKIYNIHQNKIPILVPLSYSGQTKYLKAVQYKGDSLFKEKIVYLDNFLNKKEYFKILGTIKAACFFNIRSQAAGNILWFLKNNIPVLMMPQSTLYRYFISNNVKTYNIEDSLHNILNLTLSNVEYQQNLTNIGKLWGDNIIKEKYNKLLNL